MYEGEICDARFSKCCGGRTEEFQYAWENIHKPYLQSVEDPYCNTKDEELLARVLNKYDQETKDFYTCTENRCFKGSCTYWKRRQWHHTPVLLPGKSHGQRSLVGCSLWGREESDRTERLHFLFSLSCIGEGNGNPLRVLAWRIPGTGEPGELPSMGSHRVGLD